MKKKKINAEQFDAAFEKGEDISNYLIEGTAKRINTKIKRVNIDFPQWIIDCLDLESKRLGVTRQSLVKMWIAERFDKLKA
jgi:hypothetical protein